LVVAVIALASVAVKRAWRGFSVFHTTVLYMMVCNLLYWFLTDDYLLWAFVPDLIPNGVITELIYMLIVFPCTVVLFLSSFPNQKKGRWKHYALWVAIYGVSEFVYSVTGRIMYDHGWSCWVSLAFDCLMFPMLRLHSTRPGIAYIVSVFCAVGLMLLFRVPLRPMP